MMIRHDRFQAVSTKDALLLRTLVTIHRLAEPRTHGVCMLDWTHGLSKGRPGGHTYAVPISRAIVPWKGIEYVCPSAHSCKVPLDLQIQQLVSHSLRCLVYLPERSMRNL